MSSTSLLLYFYDDLQHYHFNDFFSVQAASLDDTRPECHQHAKQKVSALFHILFRRASAYGTIGKRTLLAF
jgi:hypothetical protein